MTALATAQPAYLAALNAAQVDADERVKPLLDAREDLAFHGDALCGLPETDTGSIGWARYHISLAMRFLEAAADDARCMTATDHALWDGISPDDVPLDSLAAMIREHRFQVRKFS